MAGPKTCIPKWGLWSVAWAKGRRSGVPSNVAGAERALGVVRLLISIWRVSIGGSDANSATCLRTHITCSLKPAIRLPGLFPSTCGELPCQRPSSCPKRWYRAWKRGHS